MDFTELADESAFRHRVRAWLAEHIPVAWRGRPGPYADPMSLDERRAWSKQLYAAGFVGLTWPTPYGGQGKPITFQNIVLEELARADAPQHVNASIGLAFAGPTILHWGSEEQKARLIPALLRGDEIWCQGFSEPEAGSDLANVRTAAVLDGDTWTVNGSKIWSSFAHLADRCILLARTEPDAPKHRGLSFLLADMHAPGVRVVPLTQITGQPEFNEMFFSDVAVPATSMLGERGDGWKVAMTVLRHERGTSAMGMAAALEKQVRTFARFVRDTGLGEDPRAQEGLRSAWISLQALRYTNYRLLSAVSRKAEPGPESAVAKLAWSEANQQLTRLALDLLGPYVAYASSQSDWSALWRCEALRARGNSIEGGTSEILKNVVAERVLGLPKGR
ncbi:acyl-CoA dehydrogenase [Fodinicola feengrottensis]|uniref:Acyl-CoA dehydrogenase n=2 Tax=Fodinicola feengrottensis TaxID=435914 RepID=A0ABP4TMB0_9ACTN